MKKTLLNLLFGLNFSRGILLSISFGISLSIFLSFFLSFFLIPSTGTAFSQPRTFVCSSAALVYLDSQSLTLTANRVSENSISQVLLALGTDLASAGDVVRLNGPVLGEAGLSNQDRNFVSFNISNSKDDVMLLSLPIKISGNHFQAKLRISFDGSYPLIENLNCSFRN